MISFIKNIAYILDTEYKDDNISNNFNDYFSDEFSDLRHKAFNIDSSTLNNRNLATKSRFDDFESHSENIEDLFSVKNISVNALK